jgi:hypothetical protein
MPRHLCLLASIEVPATDHIPPTLDALSVSLSIHDLTTTQPVHDPTQSSTRRIISHPPSILSCSPSHFVPIYRIILAGRRPRFFPTLTSCPSSFSPHGRLKRPPPSSLHRTLHHLTSILPIPGTSVPFIGRPFAFLGLFSGGFSFKPFCFPGGSLQSKFMCTLLSRNSYIRPLIASAVPLSSFPFAAACVSYPRS